MKKIFLFVALYAFTLFCDAQDSLDLSRRAFGDWIVNSAYFNSKQERIPIKGKASFREVLKGQYLFEEFELDWEREILKGYGYLRYSPVYKRYELIQVDDFSKSSLVLTGTWNAKRNVLSFRPVKNLSQWGRPGEFKLEWDYHFYNDGTFKKIMKMPNKQGVMVVHSEYHYVRK